MPSRYLLETSSVDGYLLEDGSGVLLLNSPPTITSQPSSTSVSAGATANFTVVADEAVSYQWQQLVESVNYIRFSSLSSMTETGNSTTGWIYTGTASNGTAGTPDWDLPLGVAASFSTQTTLGGSTPMVGLYTSTSGAWDAGIHIIAYPSGGNWIAENSSFSSLVTTVRTYEAGDYVRIGYSNTGNTYLIEIARTGTPNTWLTLGTGILSRSGTLYPRVSSFGAAGAVLTAPQAGTEFIWTNVTTGTGGTTASYTTATTTLGMSGTQYRVLITNTDGTTTSAVATLTVTAGGGTTFTLSPSGSVTLSGTEFFRKGRAFSAGGPVTLSGTAGVILIKRYTLSPSGQVTLSGTASVSLQKNVTITPTGTVMLSGTAGITFSNGANNYTITPTGSVVMSGTVEQLQGKVIPSSGTISFLGSPIVGHGHVITSSGSFDLSGSTIVLKGNVILPSGAVVFSGTNPMIFDNGTPTAVAVTRLPLTFAGKT